MASQAKGSSFRPEEAIMVPLPNARIEDYLDRLVAPLVGIVSADERLRLKFETAAHLERAVEQAILLGSDEDRAVDRAVAELGEPNIVAREFLDRWYESGAKGPLYDRFGRGTLTAFLRFGLAHTVFSVLLNLRVFIPSDAPYRLPISPAEARRILPEPIPLPNDSGFALFAILFVFFAPVVAGALTGIAAPIRSAGAVYRAMVPIVVFSFCTGSLVLPMTEGIVFALFEAILWIPVGMAAASIAACVWRVRRQEAAS